MQNNKSEPETNQAEKDQLSQKHKESLMRLNELGINPADIDNSQDNATNTDNTPDVESDTVSNELDVSNDSTNDSVNSDQPKNWSTKKIAITATASILTAALLGVGANFIFTPMIENNKANNILSNIALNSGPVTPSNTKVTTFVGQTIPNANVNQKALTNGLQEDSAVFIFNNGKSNENRKTLDVYISFDSQNSRDFFLINQQGLKGLIQKGHIELRVHPVPTGSAFSMYAPEALSQTFVTKPEVAWDLMQELLKLSANIDTNKNEDIVELILELTKKHGLSDISSESILSGTFASWVLAVGNDTNLENTYPPIAYVNGVQIDPELVHYNDAQAFANAILNKDKK